MESQALAARSCVLVARERSEIWSHDYNGKTLSASLSPSLPALPERSCLHHILLGDGVGWETLSLQCVPDFLLSGRGSSPAVGPGCRRPGPDRPGQEGSGILQTPHYRSRRWEPPPVNPEGQGLSGFPYERLGLREPH
ncbi:unnamed protein product [Boreogadus saida]